MTEQRRAKIEPPSFKAPLNPSSIANQDARRLARVLSEIGGEGAAVDSGWMAHDQPGSWSNFAAGLGLDGPVDPASLDSLVDFYRTRGRRPRIQVTPHQHPTLLQGLEARSFVPFQTETVLARELTDLPANREPTGLTFHPVVSTRQADVDAFRDSQMTGFHDGRLPPTGM
ncbi:MAG: hypothetical protein QGG40_19045, partial [Myxococcota bacterium]|nr:hypothetical protein [Myxococcota bacterium]